MFKYTNTGRTEEKQENVKNDKNETVNKQTQEKENTNKNKEKVFWRTHRKQSGNCTGEKDKNRQKKSNTRRDRVQQNRQHTV